MREVRSGPKPPQNRMSSWNPIWPLSQTPVHSLKLRSISNVCVYADVQYDKPYTNKDIYLLTTSHWFQPRPNWEYLWAGILNGSYLKIRTYWFIYYIVSCYLLTYIIPSFLLTYYLLCAFISYSLAYLYFSFLSYLLPLFLPFYLLSYSPPCLLTSFTLPSLFTYFPCSFLSHLLLTYCHTYSHNVLSLITAIVTYFLTYFHIYSFICTLFLLSFPSYLLLCLLTSFLSYNLLIFLHFLLIYFVTKYNL